MALSAGWRAWFRLPPREDAMQAKERTGRESTCGGVDRVAWVLFFSPFLFSFFFSLFFSLFFLFSFFRLYVWQATPVLVVCAQINNIYRKKNPKAWPISGVLPF